METPQERYDRIERWVGAYRTLIKGGLSEIAAARADADARAAQHDAEQAQAEQVDPTLDGGWPA